LVAESGGELLGFVRYECHDGAYFGRELYVRPEQRRRGIGRLLLHEVERRVRAAGEKDLFASIVPANRVALAFALRCGYDVLNTVELRKNLDDSLSPRSEVECLGLHLKLI